MDNIPQDKYESWFIDYSKAIVQNPPSSAMGVRKMIMPLYRSMPTFKNLLLDMKERKKDNNAVAHMAMTIEVTLRALFYSFCDNYIYMCERLPMDTEKACSASMLLFTYCGMLHLLMLYLDDTKTNVLSLTRQAQAPPITDIWPHQSLHKVSQVSDTLSLLSTMWRTFDSTDFGFIMGMERFLLKIICRCFSFVTQPAGEDVFDDPALRKPLRVGFTGNCDLMRLSCGPAIRMLVIIRARIQMDSRPLPEWATVKPRILALRQTLVKQIEILAKMPSIGGEIRDVFQQIAVQHGDIERYIAKQNMDQLDANSVIMMIKEGSWQTANSRFRTTVCLPVLAREVVQDEENPHYHTQWPATYHFHSLNIKLQAAEGFFLTSGVNLRGNHLITEVDFVQSIHKVGDTPVFVIMMGYIHVLFKRCFYLCHNVEHAIITWCDIVRNECAGLVNGVPINDAIDKLFMDAATTAKNDPWGGEDIF